MIIVSSTTKKRKAPMTEPKTPDGNSPKKANDATPARAAGPDYLTDVFARWRGPGRKFSLEEIKQTKGKSHRAGIPNQIDPSAIETLNRESVKHWKGLMVAFVDAVHGAVREVLLSTLDDVVAQYRQTELYRDLHRIIDGFLSQLRMNYLAVAKDHYSIEHEKPFTMAQTQHREAMQIALQGLTHSRSQSRIKCYWKVRGYSDEDEVRLTKAPPEDLGADSFAQEVEMMASSRGYYEIASSRFLDVICQTAHIEMFSKCQYELIKVVNAGFHANSSERCVELMTEDTERQIRRRTLERERSKLAQAQVWLAAVHKTSD